MKKLLSTLCLAVLALAFAFAPAARAADPVVTITNAGYNASSTERYLGVWIDFPIDAGGVHWQARHAYVQNDGDCNHGGVHTYSSRTWTKDLSIQSSTVLVSAGYSATIKRNTGGMFQDGGVCTIAHTVWVEFDKYVNGVYDSTVGIYASNSVTNTVLSPTATTAMHLDPIVAPNGTGNWY